jgi:hypothetical protein
MNILRPSILPLITIGATVASGTSLGQEQGAPQTAAVAPRYQQAATADPRSLERPAHALVVVSPKGDKMLVADRLANPPIFHPAQPMLRLASLRINPATWEMVNWFDKWVKNAAPETPAKTASARDAK